MNTKPNASAALPQTLSNDELVTASGGNGHSLGFLTSHPYKAQQYFENHPGRAERFAAYHPGATAYINSFDRCRGGGC